MVGCGGQFEFITSRLWPSILLSMTASNRFVFDISSALYHIGDPSLQTFGQAKLRLHPSEHFCEFSEGGRETHS